MKKFTDNKTAVIELDKSGGSRWSEGGGFPLIYDENGAHVYKGEGHSSIIGVSGTGKSQTGSMPLVENLLDHGESVCVIDPKGEIARRILSRKDSKYKGVRFEVLDMCNPTESKKYNPLSLAAKYFASGDGTLKSKAEEICDMITHCFVLEEHGHSDPYWRDSARSILMGIITMLCNIGEEYATFRNVCSLCVDGDTTKENIRLLDELTSLMKPLYPGSQQKVKVYTSFSASGFGTSTTAECHRSELLNSTNRILRTSGVLDFTDENQFDVTSIKPDEQIAIFIIVPMNVPSYYGIAGVIMSQISEVVYELAQKQPNCFLPVRFNFVIEELGNVGKSIPNLPFLMSAARASNIRMHLFYQSTFQLDYIFGPEMANIIRDNVSLNVIYRVNNLDTAKYFSEYCGTYVVPSTGRRELIIEPSSILCLDVGQALVIVNGKIKFVSRLSAYGKPHSDDMPEEYLHYNKPKSHLYSRKEIRDAIEARVKAYLDAKYSDDDLNALVPTGKEIFIVLEGHSGPNAGGRITEIITELLEKKIGYVKYDCGLPIDEVYFPLVKELYLLFGIDAKKDPDSERRVKIKNARMNDDDDDDDDADAYAEAGTGPIDDEE